ncbi:hypothetical protein [Mesorhizobium dulcispinae]|uniref:hypothetical protein n=1 Tax=Mesorhizobium dulcispinae TaxID=3072316 RepID=UPI002A24488C|nr:hypothetical protein [Mesorhizobium sp. VK23D]MDX8517461.1 hypothetical protein [Mesorhizobium sp. VK23D]
MAATDTAPKHSGTTAGLLPIMAAVFAGFLLIGLALPVLPLHLHDRLGFGPFAVGLVTGSQFVASLLSRIGAGNYADGGAAASGPPRSSWRSRRRALCRSGWRPGRSSRPSERS